MDLRLPLGLMFAILGILLAGFGLVSDKNIYQRSLGININLIWGAILIVFSISLLWLSRRKRALHKKSKSSKAPLLS